VAAATAMEGIVRGSGCSGCCSSVKCPPARTGSIAGDVQISALLTSIGMDLDAQFNSVMSSVS
jgi:hypothetical protein